jgi:hypothetical protein
MKNSSYFKHGSQSKRTWRNPKKRGPQIESLKNRYCFETFNCLSSAFLSVCFSVDFNKYPSLILTKFFLSLWKIALHSWFCWEKCQAFHFVIENIKYQNAPLLVEYFLEVSPQYMGEYPKITRYLPVFCLFSHSGGLTCDFVATVRIELPFSNLWPKTLVPPFFPSYAWCHIMEMYQPVYYDWSCFLIDKKASSYVLNFNVSMNALL